MGSTKVISFLKSPLVTWIKTFQQENCSDIVTTNGTNGTCLVNCDLVDCYKLFDGVFLNSVWQRIETNGSSLSHSDTIEETNDSIVYRIRSLNLLLDKIRTFYSESLGQLLVLKLPDVVNIGKDPEDEVNQEDLETFLLLLLGSAVQCESKERFIEAITALDLTVQHSIVECIQQITDNPSSVWSNSDWGELSLIPEVDQVRMYSTLVSNVNKLVKERDDLAQRVVDLALEIENLKSKESCSVVSSSSHSHHHHHHHHSTPTSIPTSTSSNGTLLASSPHNGQVGPSTTPNPSSPLYKSYSSSSVSSLLTLNNTESRSHLYELDEAKSKYRKAIAELEEKTELINELKETLEQSKETCNKLRSENLELIQETRSVKAYRDEIDVLNERVRKVDRLEKEVQSYRDKINELTFYKSRVEELREDNRILDETKSMLEEQLEVSRKKSEQIPELETQLLQLKACSNELKFQQEMDREKIESLMEEVTSLQVEKKAVIDELAQVQKELNNLRNQYAANQSNGSPNGLESNLLEQLNNDASKRVLKLELENQKLHSLIENMKNDETCNKLRTENLKLQQEAKAVKVYREEIERLNERVRKIDSLEREVESYRDKINELTFYKSRVDELRDENRRLDETRSLLEEKLDLSRKTVEQMSELENEFIQLQSYSEELRFQQDMDKDRIVSLIEEITNLQIEKKAAIEKLTQVQGELHNIRSQWTTNDHVVSPPPPQPPQQQQQQLLPQATIERHNETLVNCNIKLNQQLYLQQTLKPSDHQSLGVPGSSEIYSHHHHHHLLHHHPHSHALPHTRLHLQPYTNNDEVNHDSQRNQRQNHETDSKLNGSNSTWYEYGCV